LENWQDVIRYGISVKASDVFYRPGGHPSIKARGEISRATDFPVITQEMTTWIAHSLMTPKQIARFEEEYPEKDVGLTIPDTCRLRINIYKERGNTCLVMRIIPLDILTIDDLDLPPVLSDISMSPQGLVLVTGPTGCGKSTTLAAMIDHINKNRACNIVTVEDPIEYVHRDRNSIVNQREIGIDTHDFPDALKYAMRQAPDVILIGEMRDVTTMGVAMQAAETGHLVFSTVHTTSAAETMERIVNMFPIDDRPAVCLRMSRSLRGVLSQSLVPRATEVGRVAAIEIMVVTPTIQKFIEEDKPSEMYSAITDGGHWGMQTKNQALMKLYVAGLISQEHAMFYSGNYTEMRQMIRRFDSEAADSEKAAAEKARRDAALRRQQQSRPAPAPEGAPGQGAPPTPPQ
jgi:twitching motility protein PilT